MKRRTKGMKRNTDTSPRAQREREPTLWLDKACLDLALEESLQCLPVFLAACNRLMVLEGPQYSSRLWRAAAATRT